MSGPSDMRDEDGRLVTASEVVLMALEAPWYAPVVVHGCGTLPMGRLRVQVRRAAKLMHASVGVIIIDENTMNVTAKDRDPDDLVRRAMNLPGGI